MAIHVTDNIPLQSVLLLLSCLVLFGLGPAEAAPAPTVMVANPVLTALVLAKLAALKGETEKV